MIRAFNQDATVFDNNGNRIINALSCNVERVLNSECTAELRCSREYADILGIGSIVVIDVPEGAEPFRVYELTDTGRQLTVRCKHVFYQDADNCVVYGFNPLDEDKNPIEQHGTAAELATRINSVALAYWELQARPIPFHTVVAASATEIYSLKLEECTLREAYEKLAELIGANITYKGWTVTISVVDGEIAEPRIEYRKNIKGIEAVYDASEVCTRLIGVGENNVTLQSVYMDCTEIGLQKYGTVYTRIEHFDQDLQQGSEEEEEAFNARIRQKLHGQMVEYLREHHFPSASYSIDVAAAGLSLQNIEVGQRIHVSDERIGLEDGLFTVRATTFDAVRGVLTKIELGDARLRIRDIKGRLNNSLASRIVRLDRKTETEMTRIGARITSLDGSVESKQNRILEAPNGSLYTISVDNEGNLTTEEYFGGVPQP